MTLNTGNFPLFIHVLSWHEFKLYRATRALPDGILVHDPHTLLLLRHAFPSGPPWFILILFSCLEPLTHFLFPHECTKDLQRNILCPYTSVYNLTVTLHPRPAATRKTVLCTPRGCILRRLVTIKYENGSHQHSDLCHDYTCILTLFYYPLI